MRRAAGTAGLALLTAGLYALGATLTLAWFDSSGLGPGFFPAAGVTLSALALTRRRRWPWILLAVGATELTIDLASDLGAVASVGYALANTLEPLVGAALLRAAVRRPDLAVRRDLWTFLLYACVAGPLVGAVVAATTHTVDGGSRDWWLFAARWLLGDGLGVLLVGGAALGWRSGDDLTRWRLRSPLGIGLLVVCVLASLAIFRWDVVWLGYVLVLLLVGVAFLLGTRGVGLAGLAMATILGEASATGRIRVPDGVSEDATWFALNLLIGLVVVVGLSLAAEIGEREESVRRRREAEDARRSAEVRAEAATERSRLLDAEQQARARAELLQGVTAALSGLTTPAQVVGVIAELTATALGSRTAVLAVPDEAGRLRALTAYGYDDTQRARLDVVLAGDRPVPLTAAYAAGRFVCASGRAQVLTAFPGADDLPATFEAVAGVPVLVDGHTVGALGWGFTETRDFDDDFAALATAVAAQAGLALERGRLFEAQRRHTEHLTALQDVVALMAAATSTEAVLDAVLGHGLGAVSASSAVIRVVGPDGRFTTTATRGRPMDPDLDETGKTVADAATPLADAVRTGEVVTLPSIADAYARYPDFAPVLAASEESTWAAVPFLSSTLQGGLALGFAGPQPFDAEQLSLLVTLGQVAGQSLGRAAAAEREHSIAVELQRSLLGRPDDVPGVEAATVYRPGTLELQIGGDWYDVIALPGGWAALVIGDVAGHSLAAAAAMGQLRSTLRALAPVVTDPAALVERLDDYVDQIDGAPMTSLFYAVLDPRSGALSYTCAGHPPPLVVPLSGEPRFLDEGLAPLLGVPGIGTRPTARTTLDPDDTLVLYTDGLVERRGESLTVGLETFAEHARAGVQSPAVAGVPVPLAAVCEHLTLALLTPDATDDTALLVVRVTGEDW
ncbi:SpoIIE family protein phosphatase [Kineosporia sp. R_H_3]|uniref:SpoIIE family protein phosphatase n=1 Tax=Kineosporia sp. R_H_3 TaxID=1961848 RepID=UPI0013043A5E|nr:SpoIIE family protein phosphatase [Kineosporia sp. R_H_3]